MLQGHLHGFDDGGDRLGQAFGDLAFGNDQFLRHAVHQVAALDFHGPAVAVVGRAGGADVFLDALGAALADEKVMVAADVGDDRLIHFVAADAHGPGIDDAAQGKHRDLGGAAADIDDHGPGRLGHRQPGADGGGHGFLDQVNASGAGAFRRFLNGPPFNGRRTRRHADDDQGAGEAAPVVHLADEILDHLLGDLEVADDAVAKRTDGADVAGRAAKHLFGFLTDGKHPFLSLDFGDGNHRGLVQHDAPALDVNESIGGPEIDGQIRR